MRHIAFFILLLLSRNTYGQLDSLKGKVKSVKQTATFTARGLILHLREFDFGQSRLADDNIFDDFRRSFFPRWPGKYDQEFDEKGRLIKKVQYSHVPDLTSKYLYLYDEYDNLIQERRESKGGDYFDFEVINRVYRPFRDSNDRVVMEIQYDKDPDRFEMKQYFYDENFRLHEVREISSFGRNSRTRYEYDLGGRLLSDIHFVSETKLHRDSISGKRYLADSLDETYREEFIYNDAGLLKQKTRGCASNLVTSSCQKIIYEYDTHNRKEKVWFHWRDTIFSWREYTYNPDSSIQKITWRHKGTPGYRNSVEYFYENKELIKAVLTDDNTTSSFEFEYIVDAYGNWTEQRKYMNNEPVYVRKREITYYD
jgi:hypothetical protein